MYVPSWIFASSPTFFFNTHLRFSIFSLQPAHICFAEFPFNFHARVITYTPPSRHDDTSLKWSRCLPIELCAIELFRCLVCGLASPLHHTRCDWKIAYISDVPRRFIFTCPLRQLLTSPGKVNAQREYEFENSLRIFSRIYCNVL